MTTIVVEIDDGRVEFWSDGSGPDERGFDWLLFEHPPLAEELGDPIGGEQALSVEVIGENYSTNGFLDAIEFEYDSITHLLSETAVEEPEQPEEKPPDSPKPPPEAPPIYSSLMPRSWHYVPLPDGFVFNLNWIYWLNKRQDGTIRARLMYPCDDIEPLPEGIAFEGDRMMVFAGENAARLWNHVQEIIARQFD